MTRYQLTIEYDGNQYRGWQKQDNVPTIQGSIENALQRLGETNANVYGAGRTDAGVHALGQVAHVDLQKQWDEFRLNEAINGQLQETNENIAVVKCNICKGEFHARFSAIRRYYMYKIVIRRPAPVLERGKAWNLKRKLDVEAMRKAAKVLVGKHDFTTFRSTECQSKSPVKTINEITIEQKDEMIVFHTNALSFLHHQVRSMVGALKVVGEGKWNENDLEKALKAKDRRQCPPVAPANGLYLVKVEY